MFARHALLGLVALALSACPGGEPEWPDSWEISLSVDADVGAFLSAWGPSAREVYAVGGNPDAGVIFRFDGDAWSRDETVPADVPLLNWIDGTSGDVWVVGNAGVSLRQIEGGWERVDTGVDAPLWGVWGAAPDDIWAVGGDTAKSGSKPRLAHFDGVAWAEVELPPHNRPESTRALFKVWGTAADNVFAVGMDGLILHYDGAAWSQSPIALTNDLISLWGTGPDDIIAVGGRSNGVVARWDGVAWTSEIIGEAPGLNGVWMDSRDRAWVCGVRGATGLVAPGSAAFTPEIVTNHVLHGSFGVGDGPRFAVGGSIDRSPPWQGIIMIRGDEP